MTAQKTLFGLVTVLVTLCLAASPRSSSATAVENPLPPERITQLDPTSTVSPARSEKFEPDRGTTSKALGASRLPVGAAASVNSGIGPGASVDLTWDDAQYTAGHGRHIGHWWNGLYGEDAQVSVHFAYRDLIDSTASNRIYYSGYNVYDAVGGPGAQWPRGQDLGCDLQLVDTVGTGDILSLDVMPNGRVVMGGMAGFFRTMPGGGRLYDNMVFYQGSEFNCTYDPRSNLNVTWIDSSVYRPSFLAPADGAYTRAPQVVSQWDGTSTIVHLLLCEDSEGLELPGDDYAGWTDYYSAMYFRKVGGGSGGAWSAGQVIDSLWSPFPAMAAAPYPHAGVAVTYTNASYYGGLFDNPYDLDVWLRESVDRGLTWQTAEDITNYQNAIAGDPDHFTAWLETQPLYTTDGDLKIVWTAKPTSVDPYFDGFNWSNRNEDIYHWSKSTDAILKVANGSYFEYGMWGNPDINVCGYGGSNAGWIANINLAECDSKLYCVWNQIHERMNRFDWWYAPSMPAPGIMDDCSYDGNRGAKANWEIMMAVMDPSAGGLWDNARNVSNTYTPDCGLDGDPEAQGLCGSEYKPSMEKYGFDESGLALDWPSATLVDPTPEWDPPYSGTSYLNLQYLDDQYPGPAYWGTSSYYMNPPATLNSIKWIRLACVEPIYAPQIAVNPIEIKWPAWVPLGGVENFVITVINDGNITLNVTEIGVDDNGGGWLSHNVASFPLQVPAGANHTATFNVSITAPASPTQWLEGEVWLKSDAPNNDSVSIPIRVLAAAEVEQVRWDTVTSHPDMFDGFFEPVGECVALAVSNHGEIGLLGAGSVNLDYTESGLECGTRTADHVYLKSGSPFVITADASDGSGASLTCSYMDFDQADVTGWDPSPEKTMSGGSTAEYDSVFAGKFLNRDSTIAVERTFYAPRSANPVTEIINFVICKTMVYSADGAAHNHVTVGNVIDWNVPSDRATYNTVGVSGWGSGFVYIQGTDTVLSTACQDQTRRFATEVVRGKYSTVDAEIDSCMRNPSHYGTTSLSQSLLQDTGFYRDGSPLVPAQPNPRVWWEECGIPGMYANEFNQDQAVWLTYEHDYNLSAADTVIVWTILTTVRNGNLAELEAQVAHADLWYRTTLLEMPPRCLSCCVGRVGNTNGSGEDEPTIGDIATIIDALFISGNCEGIVCLAEADINQSGGWDPECSDITIGDISFVIDYLFITGPISMQLPLCLYPE